MNISIGNKITAILADGGTSAALSITLNIAAASNENQPWDASSPPPRRLPRPLVIIMRAIIRIVGDDGEPVVEHTACGYRKKSTTNMCRIAIATSAAARACSTSAQRLLSLSASRTSGPRSTRLRPLRKMWWRNHECLSAALRLSSALTPAATSGPGAS